MFKVDGNTKDELYLLLAKVKLQDKIPDSVLKKIILKKDSMLDNFIVRIKKDISLNLPLPLGMGRFRRKYILR